MRVRVLFFGPARDLAGVEVVEIDVAEPATVADVRRSVAAQFERLAPGLNSIRFAVNEAFTAESTRLREGDEIALIPPVSGGGDPPVWVELVRGPIPVDRVREFATGDPALGGIVTFEGVTRGETDAEHGALLRLDYEAYEPMAVRELHRLADEARARWGTGRAAIVHRVGSVPPGESSVLIVAAYPHRAEAFEACRFLIDTLKKDAPIWKKDVFADGFVRWVQPPSPARRERRGSDELIA